MNHLSKKLWELDMPVLLDKFCIFKIIFKVGHLLDDLPFALWLRMIPTVRVESKGLWGGCPSPHDSLAVSTALSPPHLPQEFQQEGRDLQV